MSSTEGVQHTSSQGSSNVIKILKSCDFTFKNVWSLHLQNQGTSIWQEAPRKSRYFHEGNMRKA